MGISAKVICHSKSPDGVELITMEVEFNRFILSEVNTHRLLSRNYQSSRAVPVNKMIKQVREDPAMPVHWGKNQRGMVAEEALNNLIDLGAAGIEFTPQQVWKFSANSAANYAEALNEAGYHKQVVNRILEPFIWTKGVITATREGWESVFKLRCHKDAQPEFQALAYKIKDAIDNSSPETLNYGDWHLPYTGDEELSLEDEIKVSCSCCAQVSYRTLDTSLEKAKKIYNMLNLPIDGVFKEAPPHFSPAEHIALCREPLKDELEFEINSEETIIHEDPSYIGGNFQTTSFYQYRKMLEQGVENNYVQN